jgi:hypothetical protein
MDKPYKDVSIESFIPVERPADLGRVIEQRWLEITSLKVDKRYQRNISNGGKSNVRQIASKFSWKMFTPVIVCPIEDEFFVIIDGQHRTTAALLIGLDKVPCAIIEPLNLKEQAESYKAINANVTRITPQDMYFADLAAGDPLAIKVNEICQKVGIEIVKSNVNRELRKNECQAVGALKQLTRDYDDSIVLQALACIMKKSNGNVGLMRPALMKALVNIFSSNPKWRMHPDIYKAVDATPFAALIIKAGTQFAETRRSVDKCLYDLIVQRFEPVLGRGV